MVDGYKFWKTQIPLFHSRRHRHMFGDAAARQSKKRRGGVCPQTTTQSPNKESRHHAVLLIHSAESEKERWQVVTQCSHYTVTATNKARWLRRKRLLLSSTATARRWLLGGVTLGAYGVRLTSCHGAWLSSWLYFRRPRRHLRAPVATIRVRMRMCR